MRKLTIWWSSLAIIGHEVFAQVIFHIVRQILVLTILVLLSLELTFSIALASHFLWFRIIPWTTITVAWLRIRTAICFNFSIGFLHFLYLLRCLLFLSISFIFRLWFLLWNDLFTYFELQMLLLFAITHLTRRIITRFIFTATSILFPNFTLLRPRFIRSLKTMMMVMITCTWIIVIIRLTSWTWWCMTQFIFISSIFILVSFWICRD